MPTRRQARSKLSSSWSVGVGWPSTRRARAGALGAVARRGDGGARLLFLGAELDHQAGEECRFQLRVARTRLPDGAVVALADVDLGHAAVGDEDVAAGRGALDARRELVELAGRVRRIEHPADGRADEILRQLGAVLRPVGLEDAGLGAVLDEVEAVVLPERAHLRIDRLRRERRAEPALVAEPLDPERAHFLRRDDRRRDRRRRRCRCRRRGLERRCADGAVRLLVTRFARELGQVGRHFERRRRAWSTSSGSRPCRRRACR